jgi:hypothetical protein
MAAVATSHNITRQEDFEGTPGGTIGSTGGGPAASASTGLAYEPGGSTSQALSRRIASADSDHGFDYNHGDIGTVNMYNAGFHVWLAKVYTVLTALNAAGMEIGIGDADGSMYRLQAGDDGTMGDDADFQYPPQGGYVIAPWEPRCNCWHSEGRETTPDISVADTVEVIYNVAATTGAGLSAAMDSIDYTTDGLFLVGGDGADADGTFQDFVDADQGSGLTGAQRAGLWSKTLAGIVTYLNSVIGKTDTGTVTATVFTDSGFNVVFPGGYLSDGRNGLEFDIGNASTVITLSDGTITGSDRRYGGRSKVKRYFDTAVDVTGGATDQIAITGHGLRTGDAVIYSAEGGTDDIGPDATTGEAQYNTAGTIGTGAYWYVIKVDDDNIQLAATAQNAFAAAPTATGLTAATAPGENHSLTRDPDTRPNVTFTGTSGDAQLTRVNLILTRIITLRSPVTLTSCVISQGRQMILNDATLESCIIAGPTTGIGEAYLEAIHANDLDLIDGTSFTSGGEGHAIEITTDGTVAQDAGALADVNFSGYFTGDTDNTGGVAFDPDVIASGGDVDLTGDDITITGHPFSDGDPVYYSDEGGTAITGLTDQGLYYVNSIDANTISLHLTKSAAIGDTSRVNMTAGSTDATHKLYSANAAVFNNTGTAITLNVTGGNSPTVRNSAGSTTTVNNTVTLTVNVESDQGVAIEGARVRIERADNGNLITQGSTNASGVYQDASYNYVSDLSVTTKVRLKGWRFFRTGGTIESTGITVGVTLNPNTIVDLP